jgi:hypothetical protein
MTESMYGQEDSPTLVQCQYGRSRDGSILLYSGDLQVYVSGDTHRVQGDLRLHLGARSALRAHFAGSDPWLQDALGLRSLTVEVPDQVSLEPPRESVLPDRPEGATAWAECEPWINRVTTGTLESAKRLVLYITGQLTDWPLPRVETDGGMQGQVSFSLPGWTLRLAAIDQRAPDTDFSFVVDAVPRSLPIDNSETQLLIRRVHTLMTFLGAGGVGIGPRTALDTTGRIVWAEWAAPASSADRAGLRWCTDELVLSALPILADGLTRIAEPPGLEACVDRAISFLEAANLPGPLDPKIPTACSGLEVLAWSVLQHRQWLTREALNRLSAGSRTRLLLQWAGIPVELPPELTGLQDQTNDLSITDRVGPELIFSVRNRVVHPPKRLADPDWPTSTELFESWQLANWYLELAILRVLNYNGRYATRLQLTGWADDTVPVPWLPQE